MVNFIGEFFYVLGVKKILILNMNYILPNLSYVVLNPLYSAVALLGKNLPKAF